MSDFLHDLRETNSARLAAWEGEAKADPLFHATELGGEVGELLNVAKKLHREAMGWRGSRATIADLAEEIGDVLICLDKMAAQYGIDIAEATVAKFNRTSDRVGLPHKLLLPPKFKIGDVVRMTTRSLTFAVRTISENHGGEHRYYGDAGGVAVGEYESKLERLPA